MSEETQTPLSLEERMLKIRQAVGYVQKDAKNSGQGYRYASAEAVLTKVREAANELGVVTSSNVTLTHYQVDEGITRCAVHMRLAFVLNGKAIVFEGTGGGQDKGDKAVMKASTAALKYALASGFLISWGDDPENDEEEKPKRGRKPADPAKAAEKAASAEVEVMLNQTATVEALANVKTFIQTKMTAGTPAYKAAVEAYTAKKKTIMSTQENSNGAA